MNSDGVIDTKSFRLPRPDIIEARNDILVFLDSDFEGMSIKINQM
jgi:hypothetical protein